MVLEILFICQLASITCDLEVEEIGRCLQVIQRGAGLESYLVMSDPHTLKNIRLQYMYIEFNFVQWVRINTSGIFLKLYSLVAFIIIDGCCASVEWDRLLVTCPPP